MGKKNKKKFIDKKHAVTFKLVSRSQRDPLYAAEGSENVLMPADGAVVDNKEEQIKFGIYFDDNYNYLQHLRDVNEVTTLEPITERFRISRDGEVMDSDSISHTSNSSTLNLPSSLFETDVELDVGVMERALLESGGPRPDWDPDIVAALDGDFDFDDPDNQLEDDFVLFANDDKAPAGDADAKADVKNSAMNDRLARYFDNLEIADESTSNASLTGGGGDSFPYPDYHHGRDEDASSSSDTFTGSSDDDDDSDVDCDNDEPMRNFGVEETKSRFTDYSMTSSVIRRTEGLKLVDDIFEKFYEQYDQEECGELDEDLVAEPITGFIRPASDRMRKLAEEFEYDKIRNKVLLEEVMESTDPESSLKLNQLDEDVSLEEFEEVPSDDLDSDKNKKKWDCESIISTYSNLYNHPQLISERHAVSKKLPIDSKTGLPAGVFRNDRLAASDVERRLNALDDDRGTSISKASMRSLASTYRPKDEKPEDRKLRKQMIRQERRDRRMEKKANKLAFKEEAGRLTAEKFNLQQNLGGIKIL